MSSTSPERYRRRTRWPILVVLLLLLIGSGLIWFQALKPAAAAEKGCNTPGPAPTSAATTSRSSRSSAPASGSGTTRTTGATTTPRTTTAASTTSRSTSLGQFTDKNTLANTRPADPSVVVVTVLNASQQRGLARTVTEQLRTAGFESVQSPDNDSLYPALDLRCVGEIRYGRAGVAAARTMLLIAPCAQLVVDNRIDDTVDLALGALYNAVDPTAEQTTQLAAIHDAARPPAVIEGQTAAARPLPAIPPLPQAVCPS